MEDAGLTFDGVMRRFEAVASDPLAAARAWQARTNGKVVGCVGLHVPEEVITAAGMLPIVLLERPGPITHADAHVQNHMCGYIRSVAEQAMAGDLACLEALVILDSCHVIRMIGDLLRHTAPQVSRIEFLFLPVSLQGAESRLYLSNELAGFVKRMGDVAGRPINDADLADAIVRHNRNRRLLLRLYERRRAQPGVIDAVQVATVVKASMSMPKDEHSALLEQLLAAMEHRRPEPGRARVLVVVSGSLCETCDDLLTIIEASGACVVDDDLFVGSRYFNTLVEESAAPLDALALAYMNAVAPCPTIYAPGRDLGEYLTGMARDTKAAGVVSVVVKYCEPHYYAYLMLRRTLRQQHVPEYMLEKERESAPGGQVATRVQAFVEGLR